MSNPPNSRRVYLDNAATTPVDDRVISAMMDALKSTYGNASASHSLGRNAKAALENARKQIASYIGAQSKEIVFTSGGTEADNLAIRCAVRDLKVKDIITTIIEHKAVLTTSIELRDQQDVNVHFVDIDNQGHIDYDHLSELAKNHPGALISIMHANNEIGTLANVKRISEIAKENDCLFHSDTVQTIGHYPIDVTEFGADFLACSAHKFNGPKGVGFLYVNSKLKIKALITGGGQERNLRAGTENIAGITGLQKALEIATHEMKEERLKISELKQYLIQLLQTKVPEVQFNGDLKPDGGLYTVLSCSVPLTDQNSLLLFQLDMAGVFVSGGAACNSGAQMESHVLNAVGVTPNRQPIRFSFGRFSTREDVEYAVEALQRILTTETIIA